MKHFIRNVLIILLLSMGIILAQSQGTKAASLNGEVNTDRLNVRTGASTSYAVLNINGTDIKLNKGTKITILEELKGGWYSISFKYGGKVRNGYVASMYVSLVKDKSVISENLGIKAKNTVRVKAQSKPSEKAGALTYNNKEFKLAKNTNLTITSVRKKSGILWYGVSFTYKKNAMEGFIKASQIQIKNSTIAATIAKKTKVYSKAGNTKKVYRIKKKDVSLSRGKKIKVLKEKTVKKVKWFNIRFIKSGKTVKAWVPSEYVVFTSGKAKEQVKTDAEQPVTQKPVPLSDAEFEAAMAAENFPESYKPALRTLHAAYPLWTFKAYNTGLDFSTSVAKETEIGKSLIPNSRICGWKSSAEGAFDYVNDKYIIKDGTSWVCASEAAVAYYMDPRNFLSEKTIFMFESLAYEKDYQTADCVAGILNGTLFAGASYSYKDDAGTDVSKTYVDTFMEAAALNGISPVHLASRVKQEVVTGASSVSDSVTGTVPGYEGIYNFYNIGASDSSTGQAVLNGLKFASSGTTYMRPWNNPYKALLGGAQYIAGNYVSKGQNTLYLERFNVTPNNTYNHQYMTNVVAAYSEALKIYQGYGSMLASTAYVFYIPVYSGMPETPCQAPSGNQNPNNYLKNITVTGTVSGGVYTSVIPFNVADGGKNEYVYNIPAADSSIIISAEAVNAKAVINGAATYQLTQSVTRIPITVIAEDGTTRVYTLLFNMV